MKIIFFVTLFFLKSCGFSSYYRDNGSSNYEVKDTLVREQINLTKLEFSPKEDCERIMKDELLIQMERLDENDTKDYRYIMLISPTYTIFSSIINFSGATLGMQIVFTVNYIIVDTKKINPGKKEELPEVSFERLPSESIHGKSDGLQLNNNLAYIPNIIPAMDLTSRSKNYNEAREEYFQRQALWLRENFAIVQEGQISDFEQYITSTILLYDDYASQQRALQVVAKAASRSLMYNLIGVYATYLQSNYNSAQILFTDNRNDLDILVERGRNKITPKIEEYFSVSSLRNKILKATQSNSVPIKIL